MPAMLQARVAIVGRRTKLQEKSQGRKVAGKTGAARRQGRRSVSSCMRKTNTLYLDHENEFSVINNGILVVQQANADNER